MAGATRAPCAWPLSLLRMMRWKRLRAVASWGESWSWPGPLLLPTFPRHHLVSPLLPNHRCRWWIGQSGVWLIAGRGWCQLGRPEVPGCRRVHSSCLSLPKGRRKGSQCDPCEPAPLVHGWLNLVQQFASLVVKGGEGRALPRFAF